MKILYQSPSCFILNKPVKRHSDQIVAQCIEEGFSPALSPQVPNFSEWLPAHRLDFETSGCLLVCAPEHHAAYLNIFKESGDPLTRKTYLVGAAKDMHLPAGGLRVEGWIASRYRGSKSVRFLDDDAPEIRKKWHSKRPIRHHVWKADAEAEAAAQALGFTGFPYAVELQSGARHQLRAAFKAWDAPLINDPVYGEAKSEGLLELHAWKLELRDPVSGQSIGAVASERILGAV